MGSVAYLSKNELERLNNEIARLRAREARLVEALTEAVYEITHLSAPRPDDTETLYRPIIKGKIVDGWRQTLADQSTE